MLDQQRLATFLLEGHRGDGPTLTTSLIGPDEARVCVTSRYVPKNANSTVFELGAVPAPDTNILITGK